MLKFTVQNRRQLQKGGENEKEKDDAGNNGESDNVNGETNEDFEEKRSVRTEGSVDAEDVCEGSFDPPQKGLARSDSIASADELSAEPKSGSSTLTSSSERSTLTTVPNKVTQSRSLNDLDFVTQEDGCNNGAVDSELLKPPLPFIECPVPSPMVVNTIRIASPTPVIQTTAKSKNKKGCTFSSFGYGPNGKLEPLPPPILDDLPDRTHLDLDIQSTSSSEAPSTKNELRTRLPGFPQSTAAAHVSSDVVVPDVCGGTLPHASRKPRRRTSSNGSSSVTSFSDDSSSHGSNAGKDAPERNNGSTSLRTPDLLSPFHSRMGSNTSSGVSSVSQDSLNSMAKLHPRSFHPIMRASSVPHLAENSTKASVSRAAAVPPKPWPKPKLGQIAKQGPSWGGGSNASSGITTSSISDSFSASDAEINQEVHQLNIGHKPGKCEGALQSKVPGTSGFSSAKNVLSGDGVCDSHEDLDLGSTGLHHGASSDSVQPNLQQRGPHAKKNVSFEDSGEISSLFARQAVHPHRRLHGQLPFSDLCSQHTRVQTTLKLVTVSR